LPPCPCLGQDVAHAFAECDLSRHLDHAVSVAPGQAVTVGIAVLSVLHVHRQDGADFDGVKAVVVGAVDQVSDGCDVVVAAEGATDQAGSYSTLSMWTLNGPSLTSTSFLQGDRAGVAGGIVHQDRGLDVLAAEQLSALAERGLLAVAHREPTHVAGDVHQHVGAVEPTARPSAAR